MRTRSAVAIGVMMAGVLAWLWPIGWGGRMPVGGDVTQFSIGLMGFLHDALRGGRLPLWNDLWGYGFPGLAESQMGVFYPPHLLLYGLLSTEYAYTASLVLHTLWGALGAYWMARRMGVSTWGAALCGFSWATCGFYLIHLPHQWGYTAGSWMPWAWGMAWSAASGSASRNELLGLAAVLAIQTLPGHFQLAFCTQVGVALIAVESVCERLRNTKRALFSSAVLLGAIALVLPLAALQLWPTYRLARLAESRRDLEYLSGFAATPLHLINYVAPGLFHRSPLWRPVIWDPWRTSPEELLCYCGIVPLFLAGVGIMRGVRRDPGVRLLFWLAAATLFLSFGPNAPGFGQYCWLPGFSFFRAPARWTLATALALAVLAGKGFDALAAHPRPGRALAIFVGLAALWIGLTIAVEELRLPLHVGNAPEIAPSLRNDATRFRIYRDEVGWSLGLLLALAMAVPWALRPRVLPRVLFAITLVELVALGQFSKPVGVAPLRPLVRQSPVLDRLAREPRGTRVLFGRGNNLPQVVGAASVSSYRTLDLPVMASLTEYVTRDVRGSPDQIQDLISALHATGSTLRVLDPFNVATLGLAAGKTLPGEVELIDDPALLSWLIESRWVRNPGNWPTTFAIWRPSPLASRAWFVPGLAPSGRSLNDPESQATQWVRLARESKPLRLNPSIPERVEVTVTADGPGFVVLAHLYDPEWSGVWVAQTGERSEARVVPVFATAGGGAWQAVEVPARGNWTLRLSYQGRDAHMGLIASAVAWTLWGVAMAWPRRTKSL